MMQRRPAIHFTAPQNWINDPNGMVYINGDYHLFYQHYPDGLTWGPMHWGHAVSKDLIHWNHLPIAIYPDDLGFIFSGSCVYDKDNISGFGTKENPPIVAFYTSHNAKTGQEQQSIAYSTDYVHFEKYNDNPVIKNDAKKDFRDPKVFWNPVKNNYSMVLAAGKNVEFYNSDNLREWKKTGEFEAGVNGYGGICECPDCFPIMSDKGEKWILIISMIVPENEIEDGTNIYKRMTHVTQYYIGTFDGDKFIDEQKEENPLLIDYGTDNYAAVTFQNLEEKVMMGWKDNWDYANVSPTQEAEYRGSMTLARKMRLEETKKGYRLAFSLEGIEKYKNSSIALQKGKNDINSDTFGLEIKTKGEGNITIGNDQEQICLAVSKNEIILDRRNAGEKQFNTLYQKDSYGISIVSRIQPTNNVIDVVFDRTSIEVLAENGLIPITANVFPTSMYNCIEIKGDLEAKIYTIN